MSNQPNTRPLSEKAQRFADVWAGDNTRAAELAGYGGDKKSLGVIGARLRKDPRVDAAIRARATAAQPPPVAPAPIALSPPTPPPPAPRAPAAPDGDHEYEDETPENIEVLKTIRDNPIAKDSDRERAIARLERIADQRRAREAAAGGGDILGRLQASINDIIRAKRAREREEETR